MGGMQLQVNVVDQAVLRDAYEHPERYPNLIVRVGGFSARFVDLRPEIQLDLINRTLY